MSYEVQHERLHSINLTISGRSHVDTLHCVRVAKLAQSLFYTHYYTWPQIQIYFQLPYLVQFAIQQPQFLPPVDEGAEALCSPDGTMTTPVCTDEFLGQTESSCRDASGQDIG